MPDSKVKCHCWYCLKEKTMELKPIEKYRGNDLESYICPKCNASNSKTRVESDIKIGKAKRIA